MSGRYKKVAPYLYLNQENGFYYVRKSFKRLRLPDLFASTKEKKKLKAQAIAEQMIADHQSSFIGGENTMAGARKGKRFSEIIDEILETVTPERRIGTQEMHKFYLGQLRDEWGSYDVTRFSTSLWASWLTKYKQTKERKTFDDYVKHMNLVLRYAYREKYTTHLIVLGATDKKKEDTGRVFTAQEVSALWKHMGEETRDQFVLSYECMMRLREVLKLTWDRIDFEGQTITLRAEHVKTGSKTGKGRIFKISANAVSRLRSRYKARTSDVWVFPSPTDPKHPVNQNKTAWIRAKKLAGIRGRARWHDLRHTAISRALLEAKVSPVHVSEYAGVSIRTIQRVYLHSTAELTAVVSSAVKIP